MDLTSGDPLQELECPSCGSSFRLVGDESTTKTSAHTRNLAHFELLSRVGSGAYGAVWKARDTELDRIVAIKIPRLQDLEDISIEKFFREARAAAQIQHPHIVSVHEVGREDDQIYIVSDFINGANLREYLTGRRLSHHESVVLCRTVAEALHAAHEAGVVHRDLKPHNIMMDADGQPYVTDFGLAKRDAGEITMTVDGAILGTPAYMSPEQASGHGHLADRRADIYSLGVVLFELLTAERPFRGERQMLLMQIQFDDPPRPTSLDRSIHRDLETIVLQCLAKKPDQRYATGKDLADDLERWLNREPIAARPVGLIGRGVRWCQRRPTIASMAAMILIVTTIGFGATYWNYRRAESNYLAEQKARAKLKVELDNVQREKTRANRNLDALDDVINNFYVNYGVYLESTPGMTNVRASLTQEAIAYYESLLRENSDSGMSDRVASAQVSLGRIYYMAGDHEKANRAFNTAYQIHQKIGDDSADNRLDIAWTRHYVALMLDERGSFAEAEAMYRESVAFFEKHLDSNPGHRRTRNGLAQCHGNLGGVLIDMGRHEEAETNLRAAMKWWRSLADDFPSEHGFIDSYGKDLLRLAISFMEREELARGKELFSECAKLYDDLLKKSPQSEFRFDRALCYKAYAQSESNSEKSIQLSKVAAEQLLTLARLNPGNHRYASSLASTYTDLSNRYQVQGEKEIAANYLSHAAQINRQLVSRLQGSGKIQGLDSFRAMKELADKLKLETDSPAKAISIYESVLDGAGKLYGETSDIAAQKLKFEVSINLGALYREAGRLDDASAACKQAEIGYRELLENSPNSSELRYGLALAIMNDGLVERNQRKPQSAREKFIHTDRLLTSLIEELGNVLDYRVSQSGCRINLGNTFYDQSRFAEAVAWYDRAEPSLRNSIRINPSKGRARTFLRNLLMARASCTSRLAEQAVSGPEAELWTRQAIGDNEEAYGRSPNDMSVRVQLGGQYVNLGYFLWGQQRTDDAIWSFDRGIELIRGVDGNDWANRHAKDFLAKAIRGKSQCANNHAWGLATNEDPKRRDGNRAIELAIQSCELTDWSGSTEIDTLASAYAEIGDFDRAILWQKKAVELAPASQFEVIREALSRYEQGIPTRAP